LVIFAIASTAAAVLLLWTLYQVREQLLLVYVSGLFATGLAPLVRLIERRHLLPIGPRRLPRAAAILVIYAAVLGVLGGLIAAVLPPLVAQAQQLWMDLPSRVDRAQKQLLAWQVLPETVTLTDLLQHAPAGSADVVTTVVKALWGFVGGLFGTVTILLLTFYLLVEAQSVFDVFVRLFPRGHRARVAEVSERAAVKISAWLGGQMLLGLIIGVTTAIGLALMGVPYFYVLALIAGIGELVPMVGPLLSAIPAVIVAFTVSPGLAVAVAVFFAAQQAVENNVLVPKVMGQQVGLSAVTVIVALAIGSELLGLIGAILAVPTAAIMQVLVEELVLRPEEA
jgi:predicted PurR-regulated permease PerM